MSYPYGNPYYPQGGYPQSGYPPQSYPQGNPYQQNPNFSFMLCAQPIGLGGKQMTIPISHPIDLQYVAQQATMYLMSQGFQAYPMVGQNMAVIQAQHTSLLGDLTAGNKAYTIRICEGQGFVMVETGIANLMQDLLTVAATAGGTYLIGDDILHSKLLELAGGGATALDLYHLYQQFADEQQIMNTIMMIVTSAPPPPGYQQPYGQPPVQQPYGQPYGQPMPQPYGQPSTQQPYGQQYYPPQQTAPQTPPVQQPKVTPQQQPKTTKCWKCGEEVPEGAKFCPYCGAPQTPIKCPKCGALNSPGAKFCSSCGTPLQVEKQQTS